MTELLRKERRLVRHKDYGGVCDSCGGAVTAPEIAGIEIFSNAVGCIIVPFDDLYCPHCYGHIATIKIWASLDVTKELAIK